MRNIVMLASFVFCLAFAFNATAQMSKKEAKEWKKRIKALSPEQYKSLLEENKSLKGQVSSLKKEVSGVDDRIKDKDDQIAQYQDQVSSLRSELAAAKKKAAEASTDTGKTRGGGGGSNIQESKGVVFKVQIGAFRNKDLTKYLNKSKNFGGEEENGVRKYTIGVFRDYWEADTFKKYMREMGVKDAFIVSYKDGKRVPIKQVLEGVI